MRGFSSWEAAVFILLSAALLASLAGYSVMELRTANQLYSTISAGKLLDQIEFRWLPEGAEQETTIQVPRGIGGAVISRSGGGWEVLLSLHETNVSRTLEIKPVLDPPNLLEVPGRHNVVVLKEGGSVLIKKV